MPSKLRESEADIQKACIDWLNLQPGTRVWRQNTGGVAREYKGKKRFVRFGQKGQADITGIGPGGVRIECEVKANGGKLSEAQGEWLNEMLRRGAIAFVVNSLDECIGDYKSELRRRGLAK